MNTPSTSGNRKGRPNYPTDFKLRTAREHGINASMLFKWRRHYRAGLLDSVPTPPLLLSVTIADAPAPAASCATPPG